MTRHSRTVTRSCMALAATLAFTPPPASPGESPEPFVLTESEAVGLARLSVAGNDHLERAAHYARKAKGLLSLWRDPELRYSYSERESESPLLPEDDRGNRTAQEFTLRIFLPHPAEAVALKRAGRSQEVYYRALEESWAWGLDARVRETFRKVVHRQRDLAEVEKRVAAWRKALEDVRAGSEAGMAVAADVLRTSGDLLDALDERGQALHLREDARLRLALLCDIDPSLPVVARDDAPPPALDPAVWTVTRLVGQALAFHPAWQLMQAEKKTLEAEGAAERAARWPWFSHLQGSYGDIDWDFDLDATEWEVRAGIDLPLFSWIGDPSAGTREEISLLDAQRAEAIKELRSDLRLALASWRAAERALATDRGETEPLARQIGEALVDPEPALFPDPRRRAALQERLTSHLRRRVDLEYQRDITILRLENLVGKPLAERAGGDPGGVSIPLRPGPLP